MNLTSQPWNKCGFHLDFFEAIVDVSIAARSARVEARLDHIKYVAASWSRFELVGDDLLDEVMVDEMTLRVSDGAENSRIFSNWFLLQESFGSCLARFPVRIKKIVESCTTPFVNALFDGS